MPAGLQYESSSQLTLRPVSRPSSMSRGYKRIAILAALACGLASVKVMANPNIRRPVAQFIHLYQQTEFSEQTQDMNLWERVVYSWLLAKTVAGEDY
jgi:hypothetical protein